MFFAVGVLSCYLLCQIVPRFLQSTVKYNSVKIVNCSLEHCITCSVSFRIACFMTCGCPKLIEQILQQLVFSPVVKYFPEDLLHHLVRKLFLR